MTPTNLRELVERGTKGPWIVEGDLEPTGGCLSRMVTGVDSCVAQVLFDDEDDPTAEANAALIVAAVNALPDLLDRIEELEAGLRLCVPIIEAERAVMIDSYTARSGPNKGSVDDPEAKAEIEAMDAALTAARALIGEGK